jgi:two-component system, cell cycle sensor histidine kinase PleC
MRSTEQSGAGGGRFRAPVPGQEVQGRVSLLHRLSAAFAAFRAPQALAAPSAATGELIGTLPFGVACWSADAQLVAANERFAERLRVASELLPPGAAYSEVIRQLSDGGAMQPVREDAENRLLELHREDGSTLLIEERPLGSGGFVTLVMDITESRRTNQILNSIRQEQRQLARRFHEEKIRAEAASRAKTSFLAHLSHDIRTPLNHIIGFADMLRQQPFGPLGDGRYLNYVDAVKGSGERLLGFFANILELAELEGGRRELKRDRFTADELLVAVLRRFSSLGQRAGITMGLGGACDAVLTADRFALERMVSNLVENAIRFTPRGGKVTLAAYAAHDGVVLEITDTGIGMSPERLESLSQPFVFGDAALTRDRDGAGLGVAISRAIAELSGGRLAIDSRQGLGTTVAVSLPLLVDEEARAA